MSWRIRVAGPDGVVGEEDSDTFTLDEVARLERLAGEPWSLCNALKSIPAAKAFVVITLARRGLTEPEIEQVIKEMTLRELKQAFDWVADEDDGAAVEGRDPLDRKRRRSGSGGKPAT